ncbi:MAG: hypothetical protein JKY02_09600 [Flavobacteriaceae bacterium]|nr:hypothetical protein [Flavobacteriaceae bacterium]
MKNIAYIAFFLLFVGVSQGQEVNKYKYVVVDSQFHFVKKVDGFETSSLTKFLFNKLGYEAYLDNEEAPEDFSLNSNRCKALFAKGVSNSNMLTTKIRIELSDCNGKLVFRSEEGKSRIKDYKRAYRHAIRIAFQSLSKLNYSYDTSLATKVTVVEKPTIRKEEKKKPLMVTKKVTTKAKAISKYKLLYAQKNENGYQLVNTKPVVLFILLNTSQENKFIIKDKNGTLTKSGDFWIAEYYKNGKLVTEKYQIKF